MFPRVDTMRFAYVILLLALAWPAHAQAPDLKAAIGQLAREKQLAESCATLFKGYAPDDTVTRLRGQKLYEEGRLESTVLIEQLLFDLADGTRPDASPELAASLEVVPERRQAFCDYVYETIPPEIREALEDTRSLLIDALVEGAAELVGSLMEAGVAIWAEYNRADEVRRASISARVEAQRWRPYPEVEAGT